MTRENPKFNNHKASETIRDPKFRQFCKKTSFIFFFFFSNTGETDFLKPHGTDLLESFVDPVVIHHPRGHTIPRLGNFQVVAV